MFSECQRGLQQEDKICPGQVEEVWQRCPEGESGEENTNEVKKNKINSKASLTLFSREDKLLVDGKMYVYNEDEGRVVIHRRIGQSYDMNNPNKWRSLDSLESSYDNCWFTSIHFATTIFQVQSLSVQVGGL